MFISGYEYEKSVREVLSGNGEIKIAVAFWGNGADDLLLEALSGKSQIVCNLSSGGTNPKTIKKIMRMEGVKIRQHDALHAKVILGENAMVVGSANLSSNGLGFEGVESAGWQEAGYVTKDTAEIAKGSEWFSRIWDESKEISEKDLALASKRWKKRRSERPVNLARGEERFNLNDISHGDTLDREIFVAIYRQDFSKDAKAAFGKYKTKINASENKKSELLPLYENLQGLPKHSRIVDVSWNKKGDVNCDGVFVWVDEFHFAYKGTRISGKLIVGRKERTLLERKFISKDQKKFARTIKPMMDDIWSSKAAKGDETAKFIPLFSLVNIVKSHG